MQAYKSLMTDLGLIGLLLMTVIRTILTVGDFYAKEGKKSTS